MSKGAEKIRGSRWNKEDRAQRDYEILTAYREYLKYRTTLEELGRKYGISKQRVMQIVRTNEAEEREPTSLSKGYTFTVEELQDDRFKDFNKFTNRKVKE